jgi:hypothetical protein
MEWMDERQRRDTLVGSKIIYHCTLAKHISLALFLKL